MTKISAIGDEPVWNIVDDLIDSVQDNVDPAYAQLMVGSRPEVWMWDAWRGGEWPREALQSIIGREVVGNENWWPSYLRGVYQVIAKKGFGLEKIPNFVKARPMTAKSLKEIGLPDFSLVADKAVQIGQKFAKENSYDFISLGLADAEAVASEMGDSEVIQLAFPSGIPKKVEIEVGDDWGGLARTLIREAINKIRKIEKRMSARMVENWPNNAWTFSEYLSRAEARRMAR